MALNLKSEIDRLNNNKEKTKKVATNIDNKLVELGGERAIDLSDVPNKINKMIIDNYKKIAEISTKKSLNMKSNLTNLGYAKNTIAMSLNFKPERIFAHYNDKDYVSFSGNVDSKTNFSPTTQQKGLEVSCYIENVTQNSFDFYIQNNSADAGSYYYITSIIAIG